MKIRKDGKEIYDVMLDGDKCYEVKEGKILGYTSTDGGIITNFLYEKGDIICVPGDGMSVKAKTEIAELELSNGGPTYKDVIKMMRQVEYIRMLNISQKIQAVMDDNKDIELSNGEIAGYLGLVERTVTNNIRKK